MESDLVTALRSAASAVSDVAVRRISTLDLTLDLPGGGSPQMIESKISGVLGKATAPLLDDLAARLEVLGMDPGQGFNFRYSLPTFEEDSKSFSTLIKTWAAAAAESIKCERAVDVAIEEQAREQFRKGWEDLPPE